jgi:murein DD-endopeptidase MepM/ murein hydrolase activator NlpD
MDAAQLPKILGNNRRAFHQIIPFPINPKLILLDLSAKNQALTRYPDIVGDTVRFSAYVESLVKDAAAGVGGYGEDRIVYRRSSHFTAGAEPRSIHLGVDIWMPSGTPVFAPLAGRVHSFRDNEGFGDYGPTIILEHELEGTTFYTLYGHLSRKSLAGLQEGQPIAGGEQIGEIGPYPENGDWPPHLHLQVIADLLGMKGDFPGVASPSQRDYYLQLCPDPNLVLQFDVLKAG